MGRLSEKILLFPAGGVDRKSSFEYKPPYTTPDCMNVRPSSVIDGRARGGVRPGLEKAYPQLLGSGSRVNLLQEYVATGQSAVKVFAENFDLTTLDGSGWSIPTFYGNAFPNIYNASAAISYETEQAGACLNVVAPWIDEDRGYMVEVWLEPYAGSFGGTYALFARMADTSPNALLYGLLAEIEMTDDTDAYSGTLKHYEGGVVQNTYSFSGGGSGSAAGGRFFFIISGSSVKLYWGTSLLVDETIAPYGSNNYRGVGFGMNATEASGVCMISSFKVQYNELESEATKDRSILVAASNGILYKETFEGVFEAVSTTATLHKTNRLQAATISGKLYIADHGDVVASGVDGTVADGTELTSLTYADWTALDWNKEDFVVYLFDGTGVTTGVYQITGTADGGATIILASAPGDGTCSFRIERGPKVFDANAGTLELLEASVGVIPLGCKIVQAYRGRLVWSGDGSRLWFMSKQFDPTNYDYGASADDYGRAVAGQNSAAGQIGYPITAIMPHHDDYLIFGTAFGLWILRGDPAYPAATLGPLSTTVGVVGADAWCESQDSTLLFLSSGGIYGIAPGGQGFPVLLSARLPRSLRNLGAESYQVSIAFDERETGGVYIFVFQSGVTQTHWFMDWQTKGFFPQSFQAGHVPYCLCRHPSAVQDTSDIMLGCTDGYVRRMSELASTDDGSAIESYVLIGPFNLGKGGTQEGRLHTIDIVAGRSGSELDYSVYVGDSAESARVAETPGITGSVSEADGVNYRQDIQLTGKAAMIKLECSSGAPWDMEQIIASVEDLGQLRKL